MDYEPVFCQGPSILEGMVKDFKGFKHHRTREQQLRPNTAFQWEQLQEDDGELRQIRNQFIQKYQR